VVTDELGAGAGVIVFVVSSAPVSTGGFCYGAGAAGCSWAEAVAASTANAAAPASVARLRFM